jgi:LacI family transcriptional regulator
MRRTNAPTLQDIADEVGVSVMMASVVLNGSQSSTRVAPATRDRILEVASRLNYRRNAVARGLSRQCMDTIGVMAVIDGGELNVYFLEVLNGILEAAADYGQNTTIFSLANWQAEEAKITQFCDGRVDGMILIAPEIPSPEKLSHHTPFVTIHSNTEQPGTRNLDTDNEGGAYAVTRHLLQAGHRHIAHFMGSPHLLGAQQRYAGYRLAVQEAGLPFDEKLAVPGSYSVFSGRQRMAELLDRHPDEPLPTAIFCANDAIAYGCMESLEMFGLRIPEDISVAGFDDSLIARMTRPALTSARQPFRLMGRRAVEALLELIQGSEGQPDCESDASSSEKVSASKPRTELFPVELIVRESVGPPPTQPIIPALTTVDIVTKVR